MNFDNSSDKYDTKYVCTVVARNSQKKNAVKKFGVLSMYILKLINVYFIDRFNIPGHHPTNFFTLKSTDNHI